MNVDRLLIERWRQLAVPIRVGVISGCFLLCATILGILGNSILPRIMENRISVSISDVDLVVSDLNCAIDIVFGNHSKRSIAITFLSITLESPTVRSTMTQSVYRLSTSKGSRLDSSSLLLGSVHHQQQGSSYVYSWTGSWAFDEDGGYWKVNLQVPIREEIAQGEHSSVLIDLPVELDIVDNECLEAPGRKADSLARRLFHVGPYLSTRGSFAKVEVVARIADDRTVEIEKDLDLSVLTRLSKGVHRAQ
jgi:hypothetical protein